MYSEPGTPHQAAHFHAYYHNDVAVFGINPVEILAGGLPQKQQRLVEAWAELRQAELLTDWGVAARGTTRGTHRSPKIGISEMTHLIWRVTSFEIIGPYTLRIDFDDSTQQVIDFKPVLRGDVYGPLRDLMLFNLVTLDPEIRTLVWPNGADFDPATLHEWPRCSAAFVELASTWETVTV